MWYAIEYNDPDSVTGTHIDYSEDRHFADYLCASMKKDADRGFHAVPVVREATPEEVAFLEFDFSQLETYPAEHENKPVHDNLDDFILEIPDEPIII